MHISRIANALAHAEGMCGDDGLTEVIVRGDACPALDQATRVIWTEYRELRDVLRLECGGEAALYRHLAPRPTGAPGQGERDMLDVIAELHKAHVARSDALCLQPLAVRELLRQYYWRDYYHRAASAWKTVAPLSAAGRLDEWVRIVLVGF